MRLMSPATSWLRPSKLAADRLAASRWARGDGPPRTDLGGQPRRSSCRSRWPDSCSIRVAGAPWDRPGTRAVDIAGSVWRREGELERRVSSARASGRVQPAAPPVLAASGPDLGGASPDRGTMAARRARGNAWRCARLAPERVGQIAQGVDDIGDRNGDDHGRSLTGGRSGSPPVRQTENGMTEPQCGLSRVGLVSASEVPREGLALSSTVSCTGLAPEVQEPRSSEQPSATWHRSGGAVAVRWPRWGRRRRASGGPGQAPLRTMSGSGVSPSASVSVPPLPTGTAAAVVRSAGAFLQRPSPS